MTDLEKIERKKEYDKKYREINRKKINEKNREYHKKNKQKEKDYRTENKEKIKEQRKEYLSKNKQYVSEQAKNRYKNNKQKLSNKAKERYKNNKEEISNKQKEYYENNKEKRQKYRKINKEYFKEYYKEYQKNRKKIDPLFKLRCGVVSLILSSIKNKGYTKKSKTYQMLGCTYEEFKQHLERQFTLGMTWENQGKWHLDHIYPVSLAKDEEELIKLNHYTNFQPMWAKDNMSKGNKIIANTQIKLI